MKILITGSSGMLGKALCEALSDKYEVVGLDVTRVQSTEYRVQNFIECDITDRENVIAEIISAKPDVVIHAAAYADVDGCQLNPEKAHKVNALGTETIALACQKCRAFIYYISTDFIFDGKKKTAYIEKDAPNPINVYGQTKLEGERHIQSMLKEFIIIRTSWLFGKGGRNFVDTILNEAQDEKRIEVVDDQFGSPTYTKDLAQGINRLINLADRLNGIFHITNSGSCTWYEFAQAVKEYAKLNTEVIPISTKQYHSPTQRPQMSILENRRYQELTGEKLRHWKEALRDYLSEAFCGTSK